MANLNTDMVNTRRTLGAVRALLAALGRTFRVAAVRALFAGWVRRRAGASTMAAMIAGAAGLCSCGPRPPAGPVFRFPVACRLAPAEAGRIDTLTVVLAERVRPERAPRPTNRSERFVFRQLYETLMIVDCAGDVRGSLASSWKRMGSGTHWVFEVRRGATFWDGSPVRAVDVKRAWRLARAVGRAPRAGIDSIRVSGDRTLHVYFDSARRRAPREFADPAFAVTGARGGGRWPMGSGPYQPAGSGQRRPAGDTEPSPARVWLLVPGRGANRWRGPVIRAISAEGRDARDLLDAGADVTITESADLVEYASMNPDLRVVELEWERCYALLSTTRVKKLRDEGDPATKHSTDRSWMGAAWMSRARGVPRPARFSRETADRLARDAVRGGVRGHSGRGWWRDVENCRALYDSVARLAFVMRGTSALPRRIVYPAGDEIARALAERAVALSGLVGTGDPSGAVDAAEFGAAVPGLTAGTEVVSAGLDQAVLATSLESGDDFAYIVALRLRPAASPCGAARALLNRARWLASPGVDLADALIPLVDARAYAVVRRSRAPLALDWFGDVYVVDESWRDARGGP